MTFQLPSELRVQVNVVINMFHAMSNGGLCRIAVETRQANGTRWLTLSIKDTGVGISPEDLSRVGRPFFQARGAYDRRHDGTGLGVSIVQGLVMLHGGTMDIASRVGEGTRVTVRLPVDCEGVRPHRDRKSEVAHPSFERMSAFDLQEKIVDKNQVKKSA